MDNGQLIEQVVKKGRSAKNGLIIVLILIGVVAIPALLLLIAKFVNMPYLSLLALFALLFCIYGAWFFISSLKMEYEYAFLSSTLRIDKVIAKRRRKNMLKIDVKRLDDIFRFSDEEMSKHRFNKIIYAAEKEYSEDNYVITYNDEAKGKCAVVFHPNERLLEGMKPYCTGELKKKLYGISKL